MCNVQGEGRKGASVYAHTLAVLFGAFGRAETTSQNPSLSVQFSCLTQALYRTALRRFAANHGAFFLFYRGIVYDYFQIS